MLCLVFIALIASAAAQSAPCATTLGQPPTYHCGVPGTLRHPAPINSQIISSDTTDPLNSCYATCIYNTTGCISFSLDSDTNNCTTYSLTLNEQGLRRSNTPVVYYHKRCFGVVCPPCTSTAYSTITTGNLISTITTLSATSTTSISTITQYTTTVTLTSFSTTSTLTYSSTISTFTQTVSSGTTVISTTTDAGLYRRNLEARKPKTTPCITVTSVVTVSSDSTQTFSTTDTALVGASTTVTTGSTTTYVATATYTVTVPYVATATVTVPAVTQTSTTTRTYELVYGPANGCAYTPNDFLDQTDQFGDFTHDQRVQICASFCDSTPGCISFGMNYFPACGPNGASVYCVASQDTYNGGQECGIGTGFNGCSIYQDGTTYQLVS